MAVLALVFAALHVEKSLVEAEKSESKGEKLLAGGGIVVRGIQIGVCRVHVRMTSLFSNSRRANSKRMREKTLDTEFTESTERTEKQTEDQL